MSPKPIYEGGQPSTSTPAALVSPWAALALGPKIEAGGEGGAVEIPAYRFENGQFSVRFRGKAKVKAGETLVAGEEIGQTKEDLDAPLERENKPWLIPGVRGVVAATAVFVVVVFTATSLEKGYMPIVLSAGTTLAAAGQLNLDGILLDLYS